MASNITSSASFATNNMKPDASEEIAALWGQNVADNTAFLYYEERFAGNINAVANFSFSGNLSDFTYNERYCGISMIKKVQHNIITGTFWSRYSSGFGASEGTSTLNIDGTEVLIHKNGGVTTGTVTESFSWDSSYLSTGDIFIAFMGVDRAVGPLDDLFLSARASFYSNV